MGNMRDVTVAALMTAPRYECVVARNQIEQAMQEVGIPLTISQGVFYSQCMQMMMNDVVKKKDIEYIITVDFDSIFTAKHVQRLLNIIVQEDEIDAVAAIQPMRGIGRVLASRDQEASVQWEGQPLQVASAHFGLTVLDCKKLAEMSKPWFFATPDEDGSWGENRIDADVSFWRKWTHHGNTICLDPGTRLGHLEEMVTVFDPEMKPRHMYFNDWREVSDTMVDSKHETEACKSD